MAFPKGALPSNDSLSGFCERTTPTKSIAFTSGGGDLDLTDPTNNLTPGATELFCTGAGSVIAQLAGDAAPQTYVVVASQVLRGMFVLIKSASISCIARQ
jgi:hypothetical protein